MDDPKVERVGVMGKLVQKIEMGDRRTGKLVKQNEMDDPKVGKFGEEGQDG